MLCRFPVADSQKSAFMITSFPRFDNLSPLLQNLSQSFIIDRNTAKKKKRAHLTDNLPAVTRRGLPLAFCKHSTTVSLGTNISVEKSAAMREGWWLETYSEHGKRVYFIVACYRSVFVFDELPLPKRVWLQALVASLRRSLIHFLQKIK